MRSYKKILYTLFLLSQAAGAIFNIVLGGNTELLRQIHTYQTYFIVAIGLLFIFFEIKYWNDKEKHPDHLQKERPYRTVKKVKWLSILVTGLTLALMGLVLMVIFHADFYGNIAANLGILIILVAQYLLMTKSSALDASKK